MTIFNMHNIRPTNMIKSVDGKDRENWITIFLFINTAIKDTINITYYYYLPSIM